MKASTFHGKEKICYESIPDPEIYHQRILS